MSDMARDNSIIYKHLEDIVPGNPFESKKPVKLELRT
jgi:hypothetical protein